MNGKRVKSVLLVASLAGALAACAPPGTGDVLTGGEAQLRTRSIQTRAFEVSDRQLVMRAVIATLQDIGFLIEQADATMGTVTAQKFVMERGIGQVIRMTVTVRPRDSRQMLVRANAEFNNKPVEDPQAYQNFFVALGKALFLTAQPAD